MSFGKKISRFFYNQAETSDKHWDKELQTHYYKTTKDKGLAMLQDLVNRSNKYELNSVSSEHGELSFYIVKGKKAFVIATVIMVRPYQTAIDFTVSSESALPFDFGYSSKVVKELYEKLNKELPLIDKI
ncbi:cytosolic protein [Ornithinibacillus sp. 179-J 7C1 HS]|uniref:cytosolic protein n=1 Tax=Ornithinibacillus sp. 179-J 7C1 HS TaxID=3142384 RepID=UPI0039A05720